MLVPNIDRFQKKVRHGEEEWWSNLKTMGYRDRIKIASSYL